MLEPMEPRGESELGAGAPQREPPGAALAVARTTLGTAGQRLLAGADVAWRLALCVLEEPQLGARYLRTALLQGAATLALAAAGLVVGDGLTDVLEDRQLGPLQQAAALAASIYGALLVAQWVVVALSREFHDALSREASLRVGLEPEDPPCAPRVRLDLRWLRLKLQRHWRALWVLVPGLVLTTVLTAPLPRRALLNPVLTALWVASWWVVWTAAKSARAWCEPVPRPPWYLRGWDTLTTHVPLLRWWAPRAFGAFWHRVSRTVWAPVSCAERMPLEFSGLALVRLLGVLPLLKFFVRPLIPVAAALLLERGPEAARTLRREAAAQTTLALPGA